MVRRSLAVVLIAGLVAVAPAAVTAQKPPRGGAVVHGGSFGEPACFTPNRPACVPGSTALVQGFIAAKVLESPFDLRPDLSWRPKLVSKVDIATKPRFTLTYHIRPEARWSDGVPITASDFVFTYRELVRTAPEDTDLPEITHVRSVSALDAKTAQVVLRSRLGGWESLFGTILPRHALAVENMADVWTDRIDNPKTRAAIGSGPFLIERWERGKHIVLRRNPRYWGEQTANLDSIVVRFQVPGFALVEEFRKRAIDVATHIPPSAVPALMEEPDIRVLSNQRALGWDHFELRLGLGGHPALRSKLVRRALAFGIDRAAIVRGFVLQSDPQARQRDSAVYPLQSRHYRPNWQEYRYRPQESRRLLERAGCRRGADGIYACDGRRLSLRFVTTFIPGGFRPAVLELVRGQLREAGIEVVPVISPPGPLFDQIVRSGDFDVAYFAWVAGPNAALGAKGIFGCGGQQNLTGYCQRLVTARLDQALRMLDPERQARVLNQVDAMLARDVPVIPLYQQTQAIAVRSTVRNVGLSLTTQLLPLWNAEYWWRER